MKKLLIILIALPMIGFGQACQYGSSTDASEICDFYKGNNFATYENADIALDKILDVTGMSKRFVLMECSDISNCIATSYKGIRYILYDKDFMDAIATNTNAWSSMSILAHEIGHHVNGHSLDLIVYASEAAEAPTLAESRQMELEADEYSGFVMFKLGADLSQAQEAVCLISTNGDDSYSTHPTKDKRLRAIEKGYNNAKSKVKSKLKDRIVKKKITENEYSRKGKASSVNLAEDYDIIKAEEYFYKALFAYQQFSDSVSNNEIHQYRFDNFTKCIVLDNKNAEAYFGRAEEYEYMGDHKNAMYDFNKAIRINPNYAEAYNQRGHLKQKIGDFAGGCEDYKKACQIEVNSNAKYTNGCTWYENAGYYYPEQTCD